MDNDFFSIIAFDRDDFQRPGGTVHTDVQPPVGILADPGALPGTRHRVRNVAGVASVLEGGPQDLHMASLAPSTDKPVAPRAWRRARLADIIGRVALRRNAVHDL